MTNLKLELNIVWGIMLAVLVSTLLIGCSTAPSQSPKELPLARIEPLEHTALKQLEEIKPLSEPVARQAFDATLINEPDKQSLDCLSRVIYWEARGETRKGQAGVGYVVTNRVADKRFPKSVCDVIGDGKRKNGKPVLNRCQFGWYCDGRSDEILPSETYDSIRALARRVLLNTEPNPVGKSVFFHGVHEKPFLKRYAARYRLGGHIFYT